MSSADSLLSGRLLARNVVWNLAGTALPLLVALFAIPALIDGLGTSRFGILTIVWMAVGYFSLFDFGLGRAMTKLVAERLGDGRSEELPSLIRTGLRLIFLLGLIAAVTVAAIAPWLVDDVLNVPANLMNETRQSFWILSATLPFVVSTAGLIGVLEAHQKFRQISAIRIPLGVISFLGPVLVMLVTPSLAAVTLVLGFARFGAWVVYRRMCRDTMTAFGRKPDFDRQHVRALLSFGGWLTVTNIVGPLMVYFDRFLIGSMLTMTAVAYYTTPYEVITRLRMFPAALVGVLFPAVSTALAVDIGRARAFFSVSARVVVLVMSMPVALAVLFAPEGLKLWLGLEFAHVSTPILRWLAIGVFVNSLARLPYVVIQGCGRPDLTAKLHLAEAPLYLLALWWAIGTYGIVGAAAIWTVRMLFDMVALFLIGMWAVPSLRSQMRRVLLLTVGTSMTIAALIFPEGVLAKSAIAAITVVLSGGLTLHEFLRLRSGMYSPDAAAHPVPR